MRLLCPKQQSLPTVAAVLWLNILAAKIEECIFTPIIAPYCHTPEMQAQLCLNPSLCLQCPLPRLSDITIFGSIFNFTCPFTLPSWVPCFPLQNRLIPAETTAMKGSRAGSKRAVFGGVQVGAVRCLEYYMQKKGEKSIKTEVAIKDYQYLTVLGEGSFGRVRLVRRKATGKYSCVKIMRKEELIKSQQVDHIANEYRILSSLSHPFIVNFEGLAQNSRQLYMFLEYVPGGELFTHLREEGMFEPHKAAFYAAHIVSVFEHLHARNIIYRDLKPENILIAADGYLKLTDFGFAKTIENRTFTLCGTPEYLAPEILQNQGHGKPVDWWTLGVLIYEMIAGIDPFADDDPLIIYQNILKGKLHFPKGFDSDAKSLVRHLLVNDLSKRYGNLKNGVSDIKNHRYLNSINFTTLLAKKISPPFRPIVKSSSDTSNFSTYTDNAPEGAEIKLADDPFLKWD